MKKKSLISESLREPLTAVISELVKNPSNCFIAQANKTKTDESGISFVRRVHNIIFTIITHTNNIHIWLWSAEWKKKKLNIKTCLCLRLVAASGRRERTHNNSIIVDGTTVRVREDRNTTRQNRTSKVY